MTWGNTMNLKNGESQEQLKAQNSEALECFIYREDVVKCHKQEGMLGVVLEAPGDSDSDSSNEDDSESEDSENGHADGDGHGVNNNDIAESTEKNDHLTGHQVRVMSLDGSETVQNLCDVTVTDRVFMHGDTVSSVSDLKGQLGVVLDVDIMVDLLSPTGEIVKNVSSRKLKRIREFSVGDYVVHGPWLGRVEEVVDNVTVLFDDGSVCKVMKADPLRLKPISKSISDESGFPYYPGQRVRAASAFVFKGSRWLSGLWKASRLEGTVSKVQAGSVFVYWIASSNLGEGTNRKVPPEEQSPKDLTLLSCFPHADWQLGEWCLFNDKVEVNDNDNCLDDLSSKFKNTCKNSACKSESVPDAQDDSISGSLENGYSSKSLSAKKSEDVANSFRPSTSSNVCKSSITDDNENPESCKSSAQSNTCTCSLPSSKESTRDSWPAYRKRLRKVFFKRDKKSLKRDESFERAFLIVNITTKVDVAWQNGTRNVGLESKSLVPIKNPGDQDFFPEQYVMEKVLNENEEFSEVRRVGVVKSVNAKECVACIKWLKPVSTPENPREFEKEELVSVYELDGHPDYDYQHGDVVVRLSPVSGFASSVTFESSEHEKQEEPIDAIQDHEARSNVHCGEVGKTSEAEPDAEDSDFSWVGHITGLKDGDIEVTWGDGTISKVGPQAIYVVGREDDGESFDGGSEYSDGASWETVVDENDIASLVATGEDLVSHSPNNSSVKGENSTRSPEDSAPDKSGPLSSAISFVASLASGLFSHGRKQADMDSDKKNLNDNIVPSLKETAVDESSSQEHEPMDCPGSDDASSNVDTSLDAVGTCFSINDSDGRMLSDMDGRSTTMVGDCDPSSFKHFDITENPLDHHFLGSSDQANGGKKWVKKVQQEWNILEKNLPDGIYVRAFEDRMDLIRAVIVGACGTPYQDGLFFFDFQLPPDYPQVPPSVYYHSGGLRVNPNLYVDGKVCLSLLNTWTGKGNEVWDPASSSILQVLVSLQGLVLNSKPYFNEAGYEKQIGTIEGEKNYLPYNENTFLLNLKSMMYLMRRPPMHFEEFVTDHFRKRGYYILKACHAYSKGCLVGSLTKDACTTEESYTESCSAGFKLMLKKILPRLFAALSEVGADCQEFDHFQEL